MIANQPATDALRMEPENTSDGCVPCEFVTGPAGSGKTHEMQHRIEDDSSYGVLAATTGIAAVNLGSTTINSLLGYYDTESLRDRFVERHLSRTIHRKVVEEGLKNIIIDEASMLDAEQLDIIHLALSELVDPPGLVLTGDFCQLPPVKGKWAFEANCWHKFAANTTRLTKNWRQAEGKFLDALNLVRAGKGVEGTEILKGLVEFSSTLDTTFDGTTLVSKNVEVDRFNFVSLQRVNGKAITVTSQRWGKVKSEWRLIPEELKLKVGAYVMILSNDTPDFTYVNGDCGHIKDFDGESFSIRLVRTGDVVEVGNIERRNETKTLPTSGEKWEHYYDEKRKRFVLGGITYFPIRLGYASTVHKTQGLSLNRVQIDCRNSFFGFPSMAYVATSRARTAEGLRIVGTPELFARRVSVSPKVKEWL